MAAIIQDFKNDILNKRDFTKLSLTNQYQVYISGINAALRGYLRSKYGVRNYWINENVGLMCNEANLPTSSFAVAEVKDNYHGINQQYAHTRLYTDTDFTFYVDKKYNMIKFFEGWMDYVSGDNNNQIPEEDNRYFRRFNYPLGKDGYKSDNMTITKFERDPAWKRYTLLTYKFWNIFPKSMTSMPVTYGPADLLKVTVTFAYDRYIVKKSYRNSDNALNDSPIQVDTESKAPNVDESSLKDKLPGFSTFGGGLGGGGGFDGALGDFTPADSSAPLGSGSGGGGTPA